MKRIFCVVLALLMLMCTLVSCNGNGQPPDTTAIGNDKSTTDPDDTTPKSNLPELDFEKQTVTILSRDHDWFRDEISVEDSNTGDYINDSVYSRNLAVEEQLNVKIVNVLKKGDSHMISTEMVRTAVRAQTQEFDAFVNSTFATIMYTGEGMFLDLLDCEYLELDKPWWSQGYNDLASIGNSQYLMSGATNLSLYRLIFVTFFNKNMFEDNKVESLYDIVDKNEWTIEKQAELVPLFYTDLDGIEGTSPDDKLGFATNCNMISVDPYWSAFNMPILAKNDRNYYEYVIDVERVSSGVEKLNELMHYTIGTYCYPNTTGDGEQKQIATKFSNGQAAMATLRLIEAESAELRNMNNKYGIVPMPKLDLEQKDYKSYAHDQITGIGIPVTNIDEDRFNMTGAVLECMAYHSYRLVTPAYYETTLKAKFMNDETSWRMLDLIVNNLYLDGGVFYTKELESVHQVLRTLVGENSTATASTLKRYDILVPNLLQKLMEGIEAIED